MAGYILYSLDWDKFRQLVQRPAKDQVNTLATLLHAGLEENDGEFDEDDPILEWPQDEQGLARVVTERLALPDWYGDLSRAGKSLWEGVIFNACMNNEDIDVDFRVDSDGIYWDVIELAWKKLGVVPNTVTDVALSAFGTRPYRYHPRPASGQSRAEFDRAAGESRASLESLSKMLGQFAQDAKSGKRKPEDLLKDLEGATGVSREHKDLVKDFLSDDDSDDDDGLDDTAWTPMHSMHAPAEMVKMQAELQSAAAALKKAKNKEALADYEDELMPALDSIVQDGRMLFVQVDT